MPRLLLLLLLATTLAACDVPAPAPTPTPLPLPSPTATPALPQVQFIDPERDVVDCANNFGAQNPQADLLAARAVLEADHLRLEAQLAAPLVDMHGFAIQAQVYTRRGEGVFQWDERQGELRAGEVGLADGTLLADQPANLILDYDKQSGLFTALIPYERLEPPYAFVLLRSYLSTGSGRPELCDMLDFEGIHTLAP